MYLKKVFLLVFACIVINDPFAYRLQAAVPVRIREFVITDLYDSVKLKMIEDRLKLLDERNSITPSMGTFVRGKLFFEVRIYARREIGDQDNVTIAEKGVKSNRCIAGALDLAKEITPCAYDTKEVHVGVNYVGKNNGELFFETIMYMNNPGSPCRAAYVSVD